MAERQNWPSWRYGPNGEAQVFASEEDVPEGWATHPSKLPPAPEELPESRGIEWSEAQVAAWVQELDTLRAAEEKWISAREQMRSEIALLREENARLREKVAIVAPLARQETPAPAPQSVRRPRKLQAAGTPFTPDDQSVTLDEGRRERLAVLRDAGVEIADDATDGEIEAALDKLEQQED